jgi:NAD+ synthase (glutamine-hydrolysing)
MQKVSTNRPYYSTIRSKKAKIAHCSLNQSALDFEGNKNRIIKSIRKAKEMSCTYRAGQESEIPGYSCEDHFKELDTFTHSWEVVADILRDSSLTEGIIVETTLPIYYRSATYNCKIILFN